MSNNGKFLSLTNGAPSLETGAITGGAIDAGKLPALDASGRLTFAMMPAGVNNEALTATASEAIGAGAFINLYYANNVITMRNADNTSTGKEAHGFVSAAVASGAVGQFFLPGSTNSNVASGSRTAGAREFLGTVGGAQEVPPTASGTIVQIIGVAISSTGIVFNPAPPVAIS